MDVVGSEVKAEGVAVSESVESSDANREPVARLSNSVQIGDISQAFNNLDFKGSLALITLSHLKVFGPNSEGERSWRLD